MKTLKQQVEHKRKLIAKHHKELEALLATCTHEEIEEKSYYFSGSYYDTAYTERWNECKLCGKRSEKTHESHGWYG